MITGSWCNFLIALHMLSDSGTKQVQNNIDYYKKVINIKLLKVLAVGINFNLTYYTNNKIFLS